MPEATRSIRLIQAGRLKCRAVAQASNISLWLVVQAVEGLLEVEVVLVV